MTNGARTDGGQPGPARLRRAATGRLAGSRSVRVLVTGAGGPAAVSLLRQLVRTVGGGARPDGVRRPAEGSRPHGPHVAGRLTADLFAVDMDPHAAGLYLVPHDRRGLVPPAEAPEFVDALFRICVEQRIDVLVPTVDEELLPAARARGRFAEAGTTVVVAAENALATCLDKWSLTRRCAGFDPGPGVAGENDAGIPVPATALLDGSFAPAGSLKPPVMVKPRVGRGGRGVRLVRDAAEFDDLPRTGELMVQQYLPGQEFSLDTLTSADGRVCAVVPRLRLKIDSGIAVAGRVVRDRRLEAFGAAVIRATGLTGVANVQCRLDETGVPRLFEVNPRFPGTMPLTVAAGVDMPTYLLAEVVLGDPIPSPLPFEPVEMVRYWEDVVLDVNAFARIADPASSITPELAGSVAAPPR